LQVVLRKDMPGLGQTGELTKVPNGYFRNYLLPKGLAAPATEGILAGARRAGQWGIPLGLAPAPPPPPPPPRVPSSCVRMPVMVVKQQ